MVAELSSRPCVIFDFDGTIADTKRMICKVATQVLLEFGFTEEQIGDPTPLVGPPFPHAFCDIYGVSEDEAIAITARYREIYNVIGPEAWPLFEGIPELLANLRRGGKKLAIASSKGHGTLMQAIYDNHLDESFDVISGKTADGSDTKEAAIMRVMAELGREADECVMVGDRCFDVEAAHACGIPCVGVLYGASCPRSELEGAHADAIAETIRELEGLLLGA